MFSVNSDPVMITSEPEGAEVYFSGRYLGKTPLNAEIPRQGNAPFVLFKKDGYDSKQIMLNRTVVGAAFMNFGFVTTTSGASSWGTDASTGRMWKISPDSYVVKLDKRTAETWNESVFDFVLVNSERLKRDFARRNGDSWRTLCSMLKKTTEQCARFGAEVIRAESGLFATDDPLSFYRRLHASDQTGSSGRHLAGTDSGLD